MSYPWLKKIDPRDGSLRTITEEQFKNCIPIGWWKAFGEMLLEDLDDAIHAEGIVNDFYFIQVEDDYGVLSIVHNGGEKVNKVCAAYATVSKYVCISCGKPDVPFIHTGWSSPNCKECFRRIFSFRSEADINETYALYDLLPHIMPNKASMQVLGSGMREEEFDITDLVRKVREHYAERVEECMNGEKILEVLNEVFDQTFVSCRVEDEQFYATTEEGLTMSLPLSEAITHGLIQKDGTL